MEKIKRRNGVCIHHKYVMLKASLILPTYNQCERLFIVLETLKKQNYPITDFEVIVIDDGSNDSTYDMMQQYKATYKLLYIRNDKNMGRSYSRNIGAGNANSSLLIFMDSDRIPTKNFILEHEKYHRLKSVVIGMPIELFMKYIENNVDQIINDYDINYEHLLHKCRYFNFAQVIRKIYKGDGMTNSKVAWMSLFSCNFSIEKQSFEKIGGFDETFLEWGFENMDLGYRLINNGYKFILNPYAYNIHLYHSGSRKAADNRNSLCHFYSKYNDSKIMDMYDFLKGKISLQELCEKNNELSDFCGSEPIYFRETNLGSRVNSSEIMRTT